MRRIAYNTPFNTTTQETQYFLSLLGTKPTSSVDTILGIPEEKKKKKMSLPVGDRSDVVGHEIGPRWKATSTTYKYRPKPTGYSP